MKSIECDGLVNVQGFSNERGKVKASSLPSRNLGMRCYTAVVSDGNCGLLESLKWRHNGCEQLGTRLHA